MLKVSADARPRAPRRRCRSALVLLETLERQPPMTPRRARGHRHGDERRLRDLRVRGAGERCLLRVRVDAPRTLRDLGDAERDELLGLARDRSVLERLLIELEKRAVDLRRELAHALELRLHVDAMKLHDTLLLQAVEAHRAARQDLALRLRR